MTTLTLTVPLVLVLVMVAPVAVMAQTRPAAKKEEEEEKEAQALGKGVRVCSRSVLLTRLLMWTRILISLPMPTWMRTRMPRVAAGAVLLRDLH